MSDATSRLTDKQRRFIEEYCADFNATGASDRDIRSLTADPTDKLLHIFVALESLLLKSDTEPVVSAISDRFAFIAGRSVEERLEISSLVKTVYRLRSKYVHHALPVDDQERVGAFVYRAWDVLMALIRSRHHYSELAEMHAALDRRKFQ